MLFIKYDKKKNLKPVDEYFIRQKEPGRSIMLYDRDVILHTLPDVEERYSYGVPFYNIRKKPMVYLNILKGKNYVDVAFVQGILIEKEFPILKNDNNRKQVRSIQLKTIEDLDQERFEALLYAAADHARNSKKVCFF